MSATPTLQKLNTFTQASTMSALTTLFTPPSSCGATGMLKGSQELHSSVPSGSPSWSYNDCYPGEDCGCYQEHSTLYYSPGVCPYKWNYAATSIQSDGPGGTPVTLAVCCPPGVGTWSDLDFWYCYHKISGSDTTQYLSGLFSSSAAQTLVGQTLLMGPLSVAWQQSDLDYFTPKSAPILALRTVLSGSATSASTTSPSSGTTHTSSSSPTSHNRQHHGLSTGAAAAIGVCATLGLTAIIAGLWFFLRRYKIARRGPSYQAAEIKADMVDSRNYSPSSNNFGLPEANNDGAPHESDSRVRSAELEGDVGAHEAARGFRSPI